MDACNDEDIIEDADILLEHACDMVTEGQNIKHIVRELASLDMTICDRVVAKQGWAIACYSTTVRCYK